MCGWFHTRGTWGVGLFSGVVGGLLYAKVCELQAGLCTLNNNRMILKRKWKKKVEELHPPSPLHTRRLKSQHHEIITTFPNSTPRHEFFLGGGVHLPYTFPALRLIPLGRLLPGLMDFVFFLIIFPLPMQLLL